MESQKKNMTYPEFTLDQISLYTFTNMLRNHLDTSPIAQLGSRNSMVLEIIYLSSHLSKPIQLPAAVIADMITQMTGEIINVDEYIGRSVWALNNQAKRKIISHGYIDRLWQSGYHSTINFHDLIIPN